MFKENAKTDFVILAVLKRNSLTSFKFNATNEMFITKLIICQTLHRFTVTKNCMMRLTKQ